MNKYKVKARFDDKGKFGFTIQERVFFFFWRQYYFNGVWYKLFNDEKSAQVVCDRMNKFR